MRTTQTERVKQYIEEFGSITSLEAFRDIGVTRLSAAIYNLRQSGVEVAGKREKTKNRYGEITSFNRYFIEPEKQTEMRGQDI